eukprot:CAMPEP_0173388430 /NCGR_PEP_ID=MMETSP1356-20130122/10741_1 /TAXON_ID=77927 ORGANISM="Hemiselmis virescens, Strain PCC157" /NCGR_SAMPLE_ID=MMETSP1356 /ASSEMBLY_ACC=CAM_ASM_000847 /LENGTH=53 /DNA_ID=CAMNT_0014345335 /DNA_START=573 /DNA_END=731 /DNA_ORIENTATION=-
MAPAQRRGGGPRRASVRRPGCPSLRAPKESFSSPALPGVSRPPSSPPAGTARR